MIEVMPPCQLSGRLVEVFGEGKSGIRYGSRPIYYVSPISADRRDRMFGDLRLAGGIKLALRIKLLGGTDIQNQRTERLIEPLAARKIGHRIPVRDLHGGKSDLIECACGVFQ